MGDFAKGSRICKMQDTNCSHRVKLLSNKMNTALISVLTLAMTFNTKKPIAALLGMQHKTSVRFSADAQKPVTL